MLALLLDTARAGGILSTGVKPKARAMFAWTADKLTERRSSSSGVVGRSPSSSPSSRSSELRLKKASAAAGERVRWFLDLSLVQHTAFLQCWCPYKSFCCGSYWNHSIIYAPTPWTTVMNDEETEDSPHLMACWLNHCRMFSLLRQFALRTSLLCLMFWIIFSYGICFLVAGHGRLSSWGAD